ncbi:hypothetical protein GCM10009682_38980 [Luedemannella flava]|uniref:SCP2 domain-containing protein n=1 Tax=Luedemannella flava TaxID=349316 RepID=A0ABP4YG74_9ACTN
MSDVITEFFAELDHSDHEPTLGRAMGAIRFDVESEQGTQKWYVTMDRGTVRVSRRGTRVDCAVRADGATFERIINGELSPLASMLRGVVQIDLAGASELIVLFARYARARNHRLRTQASAPARADAGPAERARPKGRRK